MAMSSRAAKKRVERERGEDAARIGRIAEKQLSLWLTEARLTVNRAEEDKEGWDQFVQFPSSNDVSDFLDFAPASPSALVQVKASEATPHASMSLANALKLARYPGPAFVFASQVVDDKVVAARLLHIGENEIESILRAAFTARKKRDSTLNKIDVSVTYPVDFEVACEARAIRAALERWVGKDPYVYISTKRAWLANVGYGERRKEIRITWREPKAEDLEALSEFAVGLRKSADAPRIEVFDLRFGERRAEEQLLDMRFELPKLRGTQAILCVQAPGGERVEIPCETFSARRVFPFLPREHDRMRLVSKHFSLVLAPQGQKGLTIRWAAQFPMVVQPAEFEEAATGAKLFRLLRAGPTTLSLRINGKETPSQDVGTAWDISEDSDSADRLVALEQLRTIIRSFDLPGPSGAIDVDALHQAADRLRLLAGVGAQTDGEVSARFPPDALTAPVRLGERAAILTSPWLRVGGTLLVVVTGIVGVVQECSASPGELEIKGSRLPLLSKRIVPKGEPTPEPRELFAEAEQRLANEGVSHVFVPPFDEAPDA